MTFHVGQTFYSVAELNSSALRPKECYIDEIFDDANGVTCLILKSKERNRSVLWTNTNSIVVTEDKMKYYLNGQILHAKLESAIAKLIKKHENVISVAQSHYKYELNRHNKMIERIRKDFSYFTI